VAEEQVVSTIPGGHAGRNTTAEIAAAPDGRFLYVSNRGQDSIVLFAIDPATGRLTYRGQTPTGGTRPRFFTLDPSGAFMYAANQDSDTITCFSRNSGDGTLRATGITVAVGSPSAISFAPAP
jgi:6-phosphogluconolactonase (cycloisomerase 2 family)